MDEKNIKTLNFQKSYLHTQELVMFFNLNITKNRNRTKKN